MRAVLRRLLCAAFFSCICSAPAVAATGETGSASDKESAEESKSDTGLPSAATESNDGDAKYSLPGNSPTDTSTTGQQAPKTLPKSDRSFRLPQADHSHDPRFFQEEPPEVDEDEDDEGSDDYFLDDPEAEQGRVQPI